MKKPGPTRRLLEFEPLAAITLSGSGANGGTRWAALLIWFYRICSVLWLLAGLLQWAFILGIIVPPGISFESAALPTQIATGFFAVANIVAAVGLWLTAPWGGTVWLLSAAAQIGFPFALHDYGGANAVTISLNTCLAAIYITLNYMARREYREK